MAISPYYSCPLCGWKNVRGHRKLTWEWLTWHVGDSHSPEGLMAWQCPCGHPVPYDDWLKFSALEKHLRGQDDLEGHLRESIALYELSRIGEDSGE